MARKKSNRNRKADKKQADGADTATTNETNTANTNTNTNTDATNQEMKKKRKHHESPLTQKKPQRHNKAETSSLKRRHPRKSKQALKEEAEERHLTAMIFGGSHSSSMVKDPVDEISHDNNEPVPEDEQAEKRADLEMDAQDESTLMFEIDRTGVLQEQDEGAPAALDAGQKNDVDDEQVNDDEEEEDEEQNNDDDDNHGDGGDSDKPAWIDEDDDNVQVDLLQTDRLRKLRTSRDEDTTTRPLSGTELQQRLRARYKSTMQITAQTEWARIQEQGTDHDDGNSSDDDNQQLHKHDDDIAALQSSSQPFLMQGSAMSSSGRLPPNWIKVVRCPDANQADYNQAVVQAVHFHPASDPDRPLLLTAGLDKTLRFFQVGTEKSEKIHGIHFPKLPIFSACFLGDTGKVVVSGRRSYFYFYDTVAGKLDYVPHIAGREEKSLERCVASPDGKLVAFMGNDGYVILVDVHSKQWIANLKMNGSVRAVTFTPDGEFILASGSDGDVYRWDVRSRRCVERFHNQDGTITSYLAASSRRHLAVGSESGVVNLYRDNFSRVRMAAGSSTSFGSMERSPIKSIMNLQTSADMVHFNHDGQILAMSSRREKHAMKLLHVPTATVFSNWPTSKTPLNYVWSMDFSPCSKFLALGNDKGKCLLYQLEHYC